MLTCNEALDRILSRSRTLCTQRVPLGEASGRVLAEALFSDGPIPNADRSAMDGYALCLADIQASERKRFLVAGESRTGHATPSFSRGTACRILTGAIVPEGCDCVVMQEDTERQGSEVVIRESLRPWQNIRRMGEDLGAGTLALGAGVRLGPNQLALAAGLDRTELLVSRLPRVTILCTGDELRPPGSVGGAHTIPDSNGVMLAELARTAGSEVALSPRGRDDTQAVAQTLASHALVSDLVVTVGGASVGDHDVVRDAMEAAGAAIDFWKVLIKPGKPLLFGTLGSCLLLGLPGNPISAWVTFALFGLPLLRSLQGNRRVLSPRVARPIASNYQRKPGRRAYVLASFEGSGVQVLSAQSSGSVVALGRAEALVEFAEDRASVAAGELVDTIAVCDL